MYLKVTVLHFITACSSVSIFLVTLFLETKILIDVCKVPSKATYLLNVLI